MTGLPDAYKGLWVTVYGPDDTTTPTTQTPMRVNADGSILVTGGGVSGSPVGYPNLTTGQVTVTDAAGGVQIVAANATRGELTIVNGGTTDLWLGDSGVTITTGILLRGIKGAAITIPTTAAVFGIGDTGASQVVSFLESFN